MDHLVGIAEIAKMFDISRQGVHNLIRTHDDFPAPVARISAGHIYERAAVARWAKKNRKSPLQSDPPKTSRDHSVTKTPTVTRSRNKK